MKLYHMKMVFVIDASDIDINEAIRIFKPSEPIPIAKNVAKCVIEQTVPFIPTTQQLAMYADAVKQNFKHPKFQVENVRFSHYDLMEAIDVPSKGMSTERAKQIAFCALQLIRQEREKQGFDPKDTDDWLFSELDIEINELEEIYQPYKDAGIQVYGNACFENEQSPKDYDRTHFCK